MGAWSAKVNTGFSYDIEISGKMPLTGSDASLGVGSKQQNDFYNDFFQLGIEWYAV